MAQIKHVQTIEEAGQTSKGAPYWKITWDDGKFDNIFDPEFKKLLTEAEDSGQPLEITKVKQGNYWNITELKIAEEPDTKEKPPAKTQSDMSKDDWSEKDRITRASIEGQKALDLLTQLTIAGIKLENCPPLLKQPIEQKIKGFANITDNKPEPLPEAPQRIQKPPKQETSSKTPVVSETEPPAKEKGTQDWRSIAEMHKAIYNEFNLQPKESAEMLGITSWTGINPQEAYAKIKEMLAES